MTCSSFQPVTCGICICNPNLLTVGCAAAIAPNTSCGMSQVTVAAAKTNIWPWVLGIGALLYLLSKHHKG